MGWFRAWTIFFVRSTEPSKPNILSTTLISPKRFVTARAWGLPLTLLKRIGQPPSMSFWMPVISRSGSTSWSVTIASPSDANHSNAPLRSLVCFGLLISPLSRTLLDYNSTYVRIHEGFVLSARHPQHLHEDLLIVLTQTRTRPLNAGRRLRERIGRPHEIEHTHLRVLQRRPNTPMYLLWVCMNILNPVHRSCPLARFRELLHQLPGRELPCP